MFFLLIGEDVLAKDKKIQDIKKQFLTSSDAVKFDFQVLHSSKLDSAELKKALISLPAIAEKRVLLLKSIQKLSPQNKQLILEHMMLGVSLGSICILDLDEDGSKNAFLTKVMAQAKVFKYLGLKKKSVFDMTNAMGVGNYKASLSILRELIINGSHPLQLMGMIIWFWGKSKENLSGECFKKGLLSIQEADLNIKRSRMSADHAVEILVIKLIDLKFC